MLGVQDPGDLDMILTIPAGTDLRRLSRDQRELLSRQRIAARYDIDAIVVRKGSTTERIWLELFGSVNDKWSVQHGWPPAMKKGIVRILP